MKGEICQLSPDCVRILDNVRNADPGADIGGYCRWMVLKLQWVEESSGQLLYNVASQTLFLERFHFSRSVVGTRICNWINVLNIVIKVVLAFWEIHSPLQEKKNMRFFYPLPLLSKKRGAGGILNLHSVLFSLLKEIALKCQQQHCLSTILSTF